MASQPTQEDELRKQGKGAVVDGVISLFVFHLIFGIMALYRASKASKSEDKKTQKLARAGLVLGAIGVATGPFSLYLLFMIVAGIQQLNWM